MNGDSAKEIICSSINNYLKNMGDYMPTVAMDFEFDEVFFLHVILERYSDILKNVLFDFSYSKLKNRRVEVLGRLIEGLCKQKERLTEFALYEQSQIIFNYLGSVYLKQLSSETAVVYLMNDNDLSILDRCMGYSSSYDFMIRFFCRKLGIQLSVKNKRPKDMVEKIYLYTHHFLTESDYFTRRSEVSNINQLTKSVNFAVDQGLGDLVAELYWGLSYYDCFEYKKMLILRKYLTSSFSGSKGKWNFSYKSKRQIIHAQYSCICAFLEELKRGTDYGTE